MSRIIFVTGTDTGVGKTLLTATLLCHLRSAGVNALAMKPFCSGGREDVDLIQAFQKGCLSYSEANPFYFNEPVAPLVGARLRDEIIGENEAERAILRVSGECDVLIVEGSGGVLVPLAPEFTIADLIIALGCEVIVVGRNRLGTINHTCLTVSHLIGRGVDSIKVVLMEEPRRDESCDSNATIISEMLAGTQIVPVPFLGQNARKHGTIKRNAKKLKKTLATILKADTFCVRSSDCLAKSKVTKRLKTKKDR